MNGGPGAPPGGPPPGGHQIHAVDSSPIVRLTGLVKSFPGVRALRGVDFELAAGEVHALVGENGAGKSTLMNLLSGVLTPDSGLIEVAGEVSDHLDPPRAHRLGIGFVRQEPAIVSELSVLENMTLGSEHRRLGLIEGHDDHDWALACLERLRLKVDPRELAGRLSIAQRHLLDVAKTLFHRPRVIIMDEPTATFTPTEVGWLFDIIDEQVVAGNSVIYISHRLEEVFRVGHRVSVLRDGELVATVDLADPTVDEDRLISMMVGRDLEAAFPTRDHAPAESGDGAIELRVLGLVREISPEEPDLVLHGGQVLGIAGLVGSGRTELVEAIFGANPQLRVDLELNGRRFDPHSPAAAAASGIAFIPEDRRKQGLIGIMSVGENLTLAVPDRISRAGWIRRRRERDVARHYMSSLAIKAFGPEQRVATLSGGNQQKVVIAKWVARSSSVYIFDEPTKGVDVGARVEVYRQISALAASGKVVIVVSSEIPEILGLADRILVMRGGAPAALMDASGADAEAILRASFGRAAA